MARCVRPGLPSHVCIFVGAERAVGQCHAKTLVWKQAKVKYLGKPAERIHHLFILVQTCFYIGLYILRQAEVSTFVTFDLSKIVREHDVVRGRWLMEDTTQRACEPHYGAEWFTTFFNCQSSDPCQPCGWKDVSQQISV